MINSNNKWVHKILIFPFLRLSYEVKKSYIASAIIELTPFSIPF